MHELSIAMSILEMAEEESERRDARLHAIHLKIGALSGVVTAALRSAYDLAREHTAFKETDLVIEEVSVRIYCAACQAERPIPSIREVCCVECGTPSAEIVQGRELEVTALELVE